MAKQHTSVYCNTIITNNAQLATGEQYINKTHQQLAHKEKKVKKTNHCLLDPGDYGIITHPLFVAKIDAQVVAQEMAAVDKAEKQWRWKHTSCVRNTKKQCEVKRAAAWEKAQLLHTLNVQKWEVEVAQAKASGPNGPQGLLHALV